MHTKHGQLTRVAIATLIAATAGFGYLAVADAAQPRATPSTAAPVETDASDDLFYANLRLENGNLVGTLVLTFQRGSGHDVCFEFRWYDTDTFPVGRISFVLEEIYEINLHDSGGKPTDGCVPEPPNVDEIISDLTNISAEAMVAVATAEHPEGRANGTIYEMPPSSSFLPETEVLDSPVRAHDSRGELTGKLGAAETRTLTLPVPAGARAALITVTVDQTEQSGYLTLYAADTPLPSTSNINWTETGQTVATHATVNVDDQGRINVTNGPNPTHFIIDVVGHLN